MTEENAQLEKRMELSLLFDFYGELLKDSQKEIFEDYVQNDLSLSEIAEERQISRQGVHDTIKRCSRQLTGYEEKLHLIERFVGARKGADRIKDCAQELAFLEKREDLLQEELQETLLYWNGMAEKRDAVRRRYLIDEIVKQTNHILDII